ncbi:hypothetical protein H2203_006863 [Taxawa tesnikishii (nom. ined.)]|nr:hypothetical protein H2203_006863 [Dothideales sp. JES 119]
MGLVEPGCLIGCDYAGIVQEVGPGVRRRFMEGDRVCGCTRPADANEPENGAFAEVICVKADIQLHVPDFLSFEEAAAFGVAVLTTGRAFYDKFKIPYPSPNDADDDASTSPKRQLLVYGGSSLMGTMVSQFAHLSNFYVLSTASKHNHDLVKSYEADVVVDYHDATSTQELIDEAKTNAATMGPLELCVDCISTQQSSEFSATVLSATASGPQEPLYSGLSPLIPPVSGIKMMFTVGYSFLGEDYEFLGQNHPAHMDDFEKALHFAEVAEILITKKKIRPHPCDVRTTGLKGIIDGLEELKAGKVSGKKLVYTL